MKRPRVSRPAAILFREQVFAPCGGKAHEACQAWEYDARGPAEGKLHYRRMLTLCSCPCHRGSVALRYCPMPVERPESPFPGPFGCGLVANVYVGNDVWVCQWHAVEEARSLDRCGWCGHPRRNHAEAGVSPCLASLCACEGFMYASTRTQAAQGEGEHEHELR